MCWTLSDRAPSPVESSDYRRSLCAGACCRLPLFVAPKGQEKSNVSDRHCCRRTPRLMSTTLKARRLRDGQLPIVGRHEGCTHHHVRGCNVKRIQAAREQRGGVSAWTSRPIHHTLIMTGSFACGSALCSTPTRSVTHALRIGAGRSIVTKASR
jgi:hypothetical protein